MSAGDGLNSTGDFLHCGVGAVLLADVTKNRTGMAVDDGDKLIVRRGREMQWLGWAQTE